MANILTYLSTIRHIAKLIDNGDGSFSQQVAVVSGATPLNVAPAAATIDLAAIVAAPALGAVILTTGALAAGDYRVEAEWACVDVFAAGRSYRFFHGAGIKHLVYGQAPGLNTLVMSRVAVAAGDTMVFSAEGVAPAAGSLYSAQIRLYRLA